MEETITRAVIVDDQILYREGLRGLIDHWPEFNVVGEASNGKEALTLCSRLVPDLVLMDVQMPVMDGIEASRVLHQKYPQIALVMLTVATTEELIFSALRAGARGYVLKDTPARQLRYRLHAVLNGEATLSDAVAGKIIEEFNRMQSSPSARSSVFKEQDTSLNDREVEILRLVARGLSNEEIGTKLYLSVGTVKKQLGYLMQKLNLDNRVQVAVYAVRLGLAE